MLVTVLEGLEPGEQMTVVAPSGEEMSFTVPEGLAPGEEMEVPYIYIYIYIHIFRGRNGIHGARGLSARGGGGGAIYICIYSGYEMSFTVPEGLAPGEETEVIYREI